MTKKCYLWADKSQSWCKWATSEIIFLCLACFLISLNLRAENDAGNPVRLCYRRRAGPPALWRSRADTAAARCRPPPTTPTAQVQTIFLYPFFPMWWQLGANFSFLEVNLYAVRWMALVRWKKGFSVLVPGYTPVDFGRMNQSGARIVMLLAIAVNVPALNLCFPF